MSVTGVESLDGRTDGQKDGRREVPTGDEPEMRDDISDRSGDKSQR